jgi:hypothetical protein
MARKRLHASFVAHVHGSHQTSPPADHHARIRLNRAGDSHPHDEVATFGAARQLARRRDFKPFAGDHIHGARRRSKHKASA